MTDFGEFDAFKRLEAFQDSWVLRPDIPLNNSLNKANLLNPILEPTLKKSYLCNWAIILSLLSTKLDRMASDK
jgi:hypothetical protein